MSHDKPPTTRPTRREILGLAAGTALVGSLAGLRGLTRPAASADEPAGEPAIDTHIHVVHSGVPGAKPKPKEVEALYSGPVDRMADLIKAEMHQAKVQIAFGIGSLVGPRDDPLGIARTLELCRIVPGLKAVGIADPRRNDPEHLRAVEDQILRHRETIVALKAYLGYLHFGPEHPNYRLCRRLQAFPLRHRLAAGSDGLLSPADRVAHPEGASPGGLPDQREACLFALRIASARGGPVH